MRLTGGQEEVNLMGQINVNTPSDSGGGSNTAIIAIVVVLLIVVILLVLWLTGVFGGGSNTGSELLQLIGM
jgi:predicted metalloprotease